MPVQRHLSFFFLLVFPLFSLAQYEADKLTYGGKEVEEEFVDWTPSRLTWDAYKGKPSTGSDAAAITSTALGMEYHVRGNRLSFKITCRFSRYRSWGKHKTEYILQHEQGHFDITEIFARKLARELSKYKFNRRTYQADLNKIYNRVMQEKEKFQEEYDEKTDYSRNRNRQSEWLKKIQKELDSLEEYAEYEMITRR